jgi:hypothetical protein
MTCKTAAGEAVSAKVSYEAVADAMKDLEGDVLALMHLSDIAANAFDETITRGGVKSADGRFVCTMTVHEIDQLGFLINLVGERCNAFSRRYHAAFYGEVLK